MWPSVESCWSKRFKPEKIQHLSEQENLLRPQMLQRQWDLNSVPHSEGSGLNLESRKAFHLLILARSSVLSVSVCFVFSRFKFVYQQHSNSGNQKKKKKALSYYTEKFSLLHRLPVVSQCVSTFLTQYFSFGLPSPDLILPLLLSNC
jgi:hypothetical protein